MTDFKKTVCQYMTVICILLLIILTGSVSAVTITENPAFIEPGDEIAITISDLQDGRDFSMNIEGHFSAEDSDWTTFIIHDLRMPFSLEDGSMEIRTENTDITRLSIQRSELSISLANRSLNGHYSNIQKGNITAGIYDYISMSAKMLSGHSDLRIGITVSGKKKGPDNSRISFRADGIASGMIEITVLVNGAEELRKEIEIINQKNPVFTGIPGDMRITVVSEDMKTSYSADRGLKATIRPAESTDEPGDLTLIGRCYALHFDNPPRSGSGQISFRLPDEIRENQEKYSLLIAHHDGEDWISLPSMVSDRNISANTENEGIYALAAYQTEITAYRAEPAQTHAGRDNPVFSFTLILIIIIIIFRR